MRKWVVKLGAVALAFSPIAVASAQNPRGVPPVPDNMFTISGFKVRFADTPGKLARLRSLPPDKLVTRTRNGQTIYLYADPKGCRCVYVGTPEAWRTYQNGGPPGYIGDARERSQPRFDTNLMIDEMGEDADVSEPGAPTMDD